MTYLAHDDGYNPVRDVMATDDPDYAYVCIHILGWYEIDAQTYRMYLALRQIQIREGMVA